MKVEKEYVFQPITVTFDDHEEFARFMEGYGRAVLEYGVYLLGQEKYYSVEKYRKMREYLEVLHKFEHLVLEVTA